MFYKIKSMNEFFIEKEANNLIISENAINNKVKYKMKLALSNRQDVILHEEKMQYFQLNKNDYYFKIEDDNIRGIKKDYNIFLLNKNKDKFKQKKKGFVNTILVKKQKNTYYKRKQDKFRSELQKKIRKRKAKKFISKNKVRELFRKKTNLNISRKMFSPIHNAKLKRVRKTSAQKLKESFNANSFLNKSKIRKYKQIFANSTIKLSILII